MKDNELYISTINGTVYIKDVDSTDVYYYIRFQELGLRRVDKTSEWIMQLIEKSWIDLGTLYRLAQIIEFEFPDSGIDWRETFFIAEKGRYHDVFGDLLLMNNGSEVDGLIDIIDFCRREDDEIKNLIISKIIAKRAKEFEFLN